MALLGRSMGFTLDVSVDELKRIRGFVSVPVVAIGGINKNNVQLLSDTGINGVAVVSAIVAQGDILCAAREMKRLASLLKG